MTHLRISVAALAVALALVAGAGRASADPKGKPTKAQIATAKAHFTAAQQAQAEQHWDLAAAEYQAAYDAMPDPEFLFDIGEVNRLGGKRKEAITAFQKYLQLEPNGRGAPSARQSIKELQAVLAAEDAARKAQEAEAERKRNKQTEAAVQPTDATPEPTRTDDDQPEIDLAAPAPHAPGRGLRIAGIATAGVGAAAVVGGVLLGLHAKSISNDLSGSNAFDQSKYDAGKAAERNMFIAYGVGAAAIAGGVTMYVLGSKRRTAERPAVSLVPITGGVALTTAGSF